jgi:hypothetical protein
MQIIHIWEIQKMYYHETKVYQSEFNQETESYQFL